MTNHIDNLINENLLNKNLIYKDSIDSLDKEDVFLLYDKDTNNLKITTSDSYNSGNKSRLSMILPYITKYINDNKPISFGLIISLGDTLNFDYGYVPTLCFTKNKSNHNAILIPNIDFFSGTILQVLKESSNDVSYSSKENSSIFVGSSSGSFLNNNRVLFGQKCLETKNHKCIISNLCQSSYDKWKNEYPFIDQLRGSYLTIKNQLNHKIVINIDGNTMCWSRLYWQMNSNSIPLYINKTKSEIQLFDYADDSLCYIESSLDTSIDAAEYILNSMSTETINDLNNNGQNFCKTYFDLYIKNPQQYIQYFINKILNHITLSIKVYND